MVCVAFFNACDDCDLNDSGCDGDALRHCGNEGAFERAIWQDYPCAVTCREVGGKAACVYSREPVAECAGDPDSVCFDGVPSTCFGGYPIAEHACTSGSHCVVSDSCGAICALGDSPEPRCTPTQQWFCDANDRVTCTCDFVLARFGCDATQTCRQMSGDVQCTPADTDPRCTSSTQATFSFCTGDVVNECWYGYLLSYECSPPSHCDAVTLAPQVVCYE